MTEPAHKQPKPVVAVWCATCGALLAYLATGGVSKVEQGLVVRLRCASCYHSP